jgi:hypothetical protein
MVPQALVLLSAVRLMHMYTDSLRKILEVCHASQPSTPGRFPSSADDRAHFAAATES